MRKSLGKKATDLGFRENDIAATLGQVTRLPPGRTQSRRRVTRA
jgi:hypothetical protein